MKQILILLIAILLASCATKRKVSIEKEKQTTEIKSDTQQTKEVNIESKSEVNSYFNFMDLMIRPIDSTAYEMRLGDFYFKGNAEVSFNKKEAKSKVKEEIKYNYKDLYINHHTYYSHYEKKNKDTEAERNSFWSYVLVGVGSVILYKIIETWIKRQKKLLIPFTRR